MTWAIVIAAFAVGILGNLVATAEQRRRAGLQKENDLLHRALMTKITITVNKLTVFGPADMLMLYSMRGDVLQLATKSTGCLVELLVSPGHPLDDRRPVLPIFSDDPMPADGYHPGRHD